MSPFHSGLLGKVSFVGADSQYIHNFLPPPAAVATSRPRSRRPAATNGSPCRIRPVTAGEPFSPSPAFHSRYKKMLADYIRRLKGLKKNRGQLDPELMEKLKALGYLNN